jgi:agmatine/peptidylarginine deiminase
LKDYLGVTKVLWLGEGIVGDDTDGHIDDIAVSSLRRDRLRVEDDPATRTTKYFRTISRGSNR